MKKVDGGLCFLLMGPGWDFMGLQKSVGVKVNEARSSGSKVLGVNYVNAFDKGPILVRRSEGKKINRASSLMDQKSWVVLPKALTTPIELVSSQTRSSAACKPKWVILASTTSQLFW